MSANTESEWLLERLCESLVRLERRKEIAGDHGNMEAMRIMETKMATVDRNLPEVVEDADETVKGPPD
jgi:hypothetical protein